jgi:hypothetical protein
MKTKIVGIFVCMLLIATAVPAVMSVKNSEINTTTLGHPLIRMTMNGNTIPGVESLPNSEINTRFPSHPLTSMDGNGDWTETQKLTVSDAAKEYFGCDVSIDGDTALIGAPGDDSWNGSVYVFTRTGATWTQQQKLIASDSGVNDCFGVRVALQGDTALIGADDEISLDNSGAVYVFTRTGTTWTEQQKLTPSDGAAGDMFATVSLDGDTALIAASGDDGFNGSVYVFTRTGATWTQQQKLTAPDGAGENYFGNSISLSGLSSDIALIGTWAGYDDPVNPGSAYVFTRTGTTWTQQTKLLGSDSVPGDSFGCSVSLDGNTALVSAPNADDPEPYSGTAYVFTRTGTTWTQQAKLTASDGTTEDWLGVSVFLEGNTALIGAINDNPNGAGSGSAYMFTRTGTTWTQQQKLFASDGQPQDNFGGPVFLDGDTAFIGAYYDPANGPNSGSVYVFAKTNLTFSITGGFGVDLKITNNGIANITDVPWQIHVEGGILKMINKTVNGTIDIPAGKSVTVKTGMLLGFGAITITVKVADEEQITTGTQIIIFSMVKK